MDTPVKPNKKPNVQPNILMKKDEKSEKKSGVKIDETKNVIKKFARNERIQTLESTFHHSDDSNESPTKLRKTDPPMIEEVEDKEDAKTPEPKSDIKNCLGFSKPSPKKQAAPTSKNRRAV